MYSLLRALRFAALAVIALTITGCASMHVNSFVERGADLGRYRTYAWGPTEAFATGDPRLDNSPFFQERLRMDVDQQLATRGFEKTTSATPELLLHYHASVTQRVDANGADATLGYCNECEPSVYDAGTIVLDFVDARSSKLVWRGWAEDSLDGLIDNQRSLERKIDEAITRILERLPRRL